MKSKILKCMYNFSKLGSEMTILKVSFILVNCFKKGSFCKARILVLIIATVLIFTNKIRLENIPMQYTLYVDNT